MRLLAYFQSYQERDGMAMRLESRGIPVFHDNGGVGIRNPARIALFVCINAQYDDAVALMRDENHDVREPVDVEAFKTAAGTTSPSLVKGVLLALVIVVAIWVLVAMFVPHR